jgi:transposase-like protein/predicted RNA-binding Zn-ribbon protein involved in translation (DUF1610 family)
MHEFDEWFSNEVACVEYLRRLRWPEGFHCPNCGKNKAWLTGRGLLRCANCQRQASVIAGTLFEGTRKPLRTWFQVMWYITSQKYGGNALGLKRVVGFGSYQTAWTWLHKMRHAMVRPGRDRLSGKVDVDETYVGGAELGVRGRETEKKAIVVVAVEIHEPFGFGRVRLRQVPDISGASLVPLVCEMIEPGSEVLTDGWGGYNTLVEHNYIHSKIILSSSGDPAHVLMPGVHRIAALLKRWLLGTYQGSVSSKYLDDYLDEYTFRFNRRSAQARRLLFYRLVEQAVQVEHISRNQIILG